MSGSRISLCISSCGWCHVRRRDTMKYLNYSHIQWMQSEYHQNIIYWTNLRSWWASAHRPKIWQKVENSEAAFSLFPVHASASTTMTEDDRRNEKSKHEMPLTYFSATVDHQPIHRPLCDCSVYFLFDKTTTEVLLYLWLSIFLYTFWNVFTRYVLYV